MIFKFRVFNGGGGISKIQAVAVIAVKNNVVKIANGILQFHRGVGINDSKFSAVFYRHSLKINISPAHRFNGVPISGFGNCGS